jgi:hypothetical protein
MVLQARTTGTFKANVGILDGGILVDTVEITFSLPRAIDYHFSTSGNQLENSYYTYSNMAHRFEKPVQVASADGSIVNVFTLRELVNMGYGLDLNEAVDKENEAVNAAKEETDELVKKSKSGGNLDKKATSEDKN